MGQGRRIHQSLSTKQEAPGELAGLFVCKRLQGSAFWQSPSDLSRGLAAAGSRGRSTSSLLLEPPASASVSLHLPTSIEQGRVSDQISLPPTMAAIPSSSLVRWFPLCRAEQGVAVAACGL